ncbi:hypothetical protein BH24ACT3_BH24ACT3_10850 [soil metagenome]
MADKHVVVDGSNIATEGRTNPSLSQLNDAVTTFLRAHPHEKLTVVVDATFGHRIDVSDKTLYEEALLAGELVCPPAGAIGRGDAFVLQIADQADATVLSNDSFHEFHGQYDWLFDEGRLIGGKPVPEVGWVFVNRTPVRGPTSRRSTRGEPRTRGRRGARTEAPASSPPPSEGGARTTRRRRASGREPVVGDAGIAPSDRALEEAVHQQAAQQRGQQTGRRNTRPAGGSPPTAGDDTGERRGRGRGARGGRKPEAINEPLPFIEFVAAHPLGSMVEGTVDQFSSHGAYVLVEGARGYVPLKAMADPPPRSARDVLEMGETRSFVVQAIDAPRRGIDLAFPGFVHDAEVSSSTADPIPESTELAEEAAAMTPPAKKPSTTTKRTTAKKTAAKKSTAKKSTTAKKAAAKKSTAKKTSAARKTAAKNAPANKSTAAKKTAAKKSTAKKSTAAKNAPAKKTTAKKTTAKKTSAAKKTTSKRTAATKKR